MVGWLRRLREFVGSGAACKCVDLVSLSASAETSGRPVVRQRMIDKALTSAAFPITQASEASLFSNLLT